MPRISRKYLDSKYCHIMVQGINKEYIFEKEIMKEKYKQLIFENAKKCQIVIIAYCIMDNHTHILVRAENSQLISKFMAKNNSSYGQFYNKINNRIGYVFRDRYRAEPILNESHLQNCIKYIHENPVKANIVKSCDRYKFSSYNDFANNHIEKTLIKEIYGIDEGYISKISGKYEDYKFIETNNKFGENELEDFYKIWKEYENIDFKDKNNVLKISKELKRRSNAKK